MDKLYISVIINLKLYENLEIFYVCRHDGYFWL